MSTVYFKRCLFAMLTLAVLSAAAAERNLSRWDYLGKNIPDPWNGIEITVQEHNLTPDGQRTLQVVCGYDRDDLEWPSFLAYRTPASLFSGVKQAEIVFYVKGKRGNVIGLRVTAHAPNSTHLSKTVEYTMTGEWQQIRYREALSNAPSARWVNAPRLLLLKFTAGDRFRFGPLTLNAID
jgi:hypothetical protein